MSGQEMGDHIAQLVPSGDVALFIATPGSLNIQPRIDGAQATLKKHPSIKPHVVATGAALTQELSTIQAYITAHSSYKGFFAVDGGSTQSIGQTIQKQNLIGKVKGGGYDLTPITQQTVASGAMQFTIDQQPYLQGFLPILQLYMYQVSQTLTGIADVNTGLKFLDKTTVAPYNSTKSRYEGTSTAPGVTEVVGFAAAAMATASDKTVATAPPPKGPASGWARRGGALSLGQRFLTLREGSIIVITLVAFVYFAADDQPLPDHVEPQGAAPVLRAVRDPGGGRGVRDDQRRDRPVDRRRVPVHAVHLLQAGANVGLPLIPAMIGALIVAMLVGLFNGRGDRSSGSRRSWPRSARCSRSTA